MRIIMAPMPRNMADDDLIPTKDMADYYARRADAGMSAEFRIGIF